YALAVALAAGATAAASCAHAVNNLGDDGGGGGGISIGTPPPGGDNTPSIQTQCTSSQPCQDFPSTPFMDGNVPSNVQQMFGNAGSGSMNGGPCIWEPQDNTLFPRNWLRPRVLFTASGSLGLFEIRIHTDVEANDLVVYTSNTQWKLDNTPDSGGQTLWDKLRSKALMVPITVTVRGIPSGGGTPVVSAPASFQIAPAEAGGALIYWTTDTFDNSANNTTLQGFQVGDEGTTTALTSSQVQQPVRAQSIDGGNLLPAAYNNVFCIGCHTATPDGKYVAFTSQWPWANALATVQADAGVGLAPPWLTVSAASNMSPNINGYYAPPTVAQVMMGIQTFSPAHYRDDPSGNPVERKVVASIGESWNSTSLTDPGKATGVVSELVWFDLMWNGQVPTGMMYNPWQPGQLTTPLPLAPRCNANAAGNCATSANSTGGWGIIKRSGDSNSAGAPNWSHNIDGNTDVIAYSSTNLGTKDGRMDCSVSTASCSSDVYLVPFNDGAGGSATPLPGASDGSKNEYYPAWSPDDQLIAFNSVPSGTSMYNEPAAEVSIVPYNGGNGGTATRLAANDPPMCSNRVSPGVQNTWPKWAPNVQTSKAGDPGGAGLTYYWVTFSSTRHPKANGKQQLYVAGVVFNADTNTFKTYSGIYLWNQSYLVNNLIPSWQNLQIAHGTTINPQ
ncbi:MAG TPA: hypothetical protein VE987_22290, partial [Polyangiaceae bacterium]|nr:hypothetical protein [Polyangiaceae bacterium]